MITFASGSLSISLSNPELGDSEQYNLKTSFKLTMDNSMHSYLRTPVNGKFLLSFTDLTDTELLDFITFLENTADLTLEYTDYDNDIWNGIFVNLPQIFETFARRPCDSGEEEVHRITLEFEYAL